MNAADIDNFSLMKFCMSPSLLWIVFLIEIEN